MNPNSQNTRTKQTKSSLNSAMRTLAVDINANGQRVRIDPSSISHDAFTAHHGTAANGTQVNSLHSTTIGKSTILRSGKSGPMISATTDEMEVFATQFLIAKGFSIQVPMFNSNAAAG